MEEVKVVNGQKFIDGIWVRDIPNFSRYLADVVNGKIYRLARGKRVGKWLDPKPNDVGYVYTTLVDDKGEGIRTSVHSIIMSAAIESEPSYWLGKNHEIDHKNEDKSDNRFENLHLTTKQINHSKINRTGKRRKLKKEEVLKLRQEFAEDQPKPKIQWYRQKARELGLGAWQTVQYNVLFYSNKEVV